MPQAKETVLVVDDEENIVDVVKAYLEKEGYKVFVAYSGKDALDVFDKEAVDFIILDLMLPDLSGEQVCKKIRVRSQVPILMLYTHIKNLRHKLQDNENRYIHTVYGIGYKFLGD